MNRYIKKGKNGNPDMVGVLVSSEGHGAGFSTEDRTDRTEELIFDPKIIRMLISKKKDADDIRKYCDKTYGYAFARNCGIRDLAVNFVPIGTKFRIDHYDGLETLMTEKDESWFTA